MNTLFTHPLALIPTGVLALAALFFAFRAQARPGVGVQAVGQKPWLLGLGMTLVLLGLGLGIAEPRWGTPDYPRLTVHVILDASRSMGVPDCEGKTRWQVATGLLDRLWSENLPGVRYGLDLLTGDLIPRLPPGEDRQLLRDNLRALAPGELGSPGTGLAKGLIQAAATVDPKAPAILLLVTDGDETWEGGDEAVARAVSQLRKQKLSLFTLALGQAQPSPVPEAPQPPSPEGAAPPKPETSAARPDLLARLAEGTGGKALDAKADLAGLLKDLAAGKAPLPAARAIVPARPEWGAWIALLGLALWILAAGKPLRAWRPVLGLLLLLPAMPARAELPLPQSVKAWVAQVAMERGDLELARRMRPRGDRPLHRLLAAQIELRSSRPQEALGTLAPLLGQGVPQPLPAWRVPALLLAGRAQLALGQPDEARALMERLLRESPGQAEAIHNLQALSPDQVPPPPNPKKPPPPPPPRPSQGARQDELEGIRQQLPHKPPPSGGIKDT